MTTARERWYPPDPPPTPRRLRKHALADDVRALIADVLYLDIENASESSLAEAEASLALARKAVAALPDIRSQGLFVGDDSSLFERSPLSGRVNALAAPLSLHFEGELTKGHAVYGEAYEGPPGLVHGGYVMSAFDDLLGVAQAASGIAGFTGTLSVRLHSGTPLNQRIDYEAGVSEVTGRKITAWGRSYHGDTLCAEATGIFIEPRGGHPVRQLLADARARHDD
jgi:acyl-coenzyme A thioesterase PaaI-like protein